MTSIIRISFLSLILVSLASATGCSILGAPFGISAPSFELSEQAERLREASAVASTAPKELDKHLLPTYILEPGDTLLVLPVSIDSAVRLPGDQTILQDGTIDLAQYGQPVVAGKTVSSVENEIQQLILNYHKKEIEEEEFEPKDALVDARLVGRVSKIYYVFGEVNAPGSYPLDGRETVLDAIIAAGGLTRAASTNSIILSRPTSPCSPRLVMPVCYDNITQIADTSTNYQLLPGDRIFVSSKSFEESIFPSRGKKAPCTACQYAQPLDPIQCGVIGTVTSPTPSATIVGPTIEPYDPGMIMPQTGEVPMPAPSPVIPYVPEQ